MSAVVASAVRYEVAGAVLIDGVDFAAKPGQLAVVAGPNGAGKTTLLRLLAGDLAPTTGSVEIGGAPVAGVARMELARSRAFLGQGRTAGIPFAVADVVAMGGWSNPTSAVEVMAALQAVDVVELRDRTVGSLSSGEHTRVELARILVQDTPILLLDEPLTALDIGHQELVMQHLRHLASTGKAVVVVLHDLNAAAAYADKVALLAGGRVAAIGEPAAVLEPALLTEVYRVPMQVHQVAGRTVVLPAD